MAQPAREQVPAAQVRVQAAQVEVPAQERASVQARVPELALAQDGAPAQERVSVQVWVPGLARAQVASAQAPERPGAVALARAGAVQALAARVSVVQAWVVPAWVVQASLVLVSAARAWVVVQAAGVARSVAPRPAEPRFPCAEFRSRRTPAIPAAIRAGRLQWRRQYRSVGSS